MDQGLAALIAGLAGTLGAGIGGLCAVWGARIGAEKTAESARQQVRDQASTEHLRWLRDRRTEAYVELLSVWDAAVRTVQEAMTQVDDLDLERRRGTIQVDFHDAGSRVMESIVGVTHPAYSLVERISMLGPDCVKGAAEEMMASLYSMKAEAGVFWSRKVTQEPPERDPGWGPFNEKYLAALDLSSVTGSALMIAWRVDLG